MKDTMYGLQFADPKGLTPHGRLQRILQREKIVLNMPLPLEGLEVDDPEHFLSCLGKCHTKKAWIRIATSIYRRTVLVDHTSGDYHVHVTQSALDKDGAVVNLFDEIFVRDHDDCVNAFGRYILNIYAKDRLNGVQNCQLEKDWPVLECYFGEIQYDFEEAKAWATME